MNELDAILETCHQDVAGAAHAVLATVVHVKGSAYRRPGARMLILPDGRRVGTVSGGCLEGEITRKAWWYTESGKPSVRVFDTSSDDDAVWEFGLGCNGVVQVLLERLDTPQAREMLDILARHRLANTAVVLATVIRTAACDGVKVGDRMYLDESWNPAGPLKDSALAVPVLQYASAALREGKNCLAHIGGSEVFIERIAPALSLVVFGAGHDAAPVVRFAKDLGWRVTVADGRPNYARADRFPEADRVVVMPPRNPLQDISVDANTAVVMMTHNYPLDRILLPHILDARPRYLGLLGPKSRTERLFDELGRNRIPAHVHAPVGLDLGSDNPTAIALAVVAEIQAALCGRPGGMLKHREGAIHAPATEIGTPASAAAPPEAERPGFCETISASETISQSYV